MQEIIDKASQIRLAVFDVDGVMTDGSLVFDNSGEEYKTFNVRDGLGLVMLRESGIRTAVITGRKSNMVADRMADLKIDYVHQGVRDKKACMEKLMNENGLGSEHISYTGDDLIDIPALSVAGLSVAVADGDQRVIAAADWVTSRPGGRGAVREVCDLILESQGLLEVFCQQNYQL